MERRGNSHLKHMGMLRGVILGLALGVPGKTPIFLAVKASLWVAREEISKINYVFRIFDTSVVVSKSLSHALIGSR